MPELQQWIVRIQALGLVCFDAFVVTLSRWQDKITNYFTRRQSSGLVEGLNKIKVIKRRCFGIYKLGRLFQHIWLYAQGRHVLYN